MNDRDFDRELRSWLDDEASSAPADDLVPALESELEGRRPKSRIHALLTERPMRHERRLGFGSPVLHATYLVVLVAVVVAIGASALLIGSRLLPPTPLPRDTSGLIAYDAGGRLFVVAPDGNDGRELTVGVSGVASPTWSPDGRLLALWAASPSGEGDALYVYDVGEERTTLVADQLWIATDKRPSWSPDSTRLAYSSESGPDENDEDLFVVNADGTGRSRLAPPHPDDPLRRLLPAWSPDGQWIAYQGIPASLPADESEVWVIRADGSGERRLAIEGRYSWPPGAHWDPDATRARLAVAVGTTRSRAAIHVYDVVADVDAVVSTEAENGQSPAWSPDGRLAWLDVAEDGTATIRIRLREGGADVISVPAAGIAGPPSSIAWSSDGTQIYGTNAEKTAVIIVSADDQGPPVIVRHVAGHGMPSWQPTSD